MESEIATIVKAAPDRLIGLAPDGMLRLVWDMATLRLPTHDLPHLAAVLDAWGQEEELPGLRRGYYRLLPSPDGGVQLWVRGIGLLLSREELRVLTGLIAAAMGELCAPLCRQPRTPFGLGYRRMNAPRPSTDRQN